MVRVDANVRLGVMELHVVKVTSVLDQWTVPVNLSDPLVDMWEVETDHTNVTLEVLHIDWIKSNDGCKDSDIGLSECVTEQVLDTLGIVVLEDVLNLIEVNKQVCNLGLVHLLLGGETGLVNGIIDVLISQCVKVIDLLQDRRWSIVDSLELFILNEIVELGVQESDDFGRLVADDCLLLLIPEDRNGESASVFWVGLVVDL